MFEPQADRRPLYVRELSQYLESNLWEVWNPVSGIFRPEIFNGPPGMIWLFAADISHSEISNGGLHQLFTNPGGVLVPEAIYGHQLLGFDAAANLISTAMAWFGKDYPRQQQIRNDLLRRHQTGGNRIDREMSDPFINLDIAYDEVIPDKVFENAANVFITNVSTQRGPSAT